MIVSFINYYYLWIFWISFYIFLFIFCS